MKLFYFLVIFSKVLLICGLYQELLLTRLNCTSSNTKVLKIKVCEVTAAHELNLKVEFFRNITNATVKYSLCNLTHNFYKMFRQVYTRTT